MKTFWAALIVFVLLIVLITINACYIQKTAAKIQEVLSSLSSAPNDENGLEGLDELWRKHREIFALSVGHEEVKEIDKQLIAMHVAAREGAKNDFHCARLLAIETLDHIRQLEKFAFSNLA